MTRDCQTRIDWAVPEAPPASLAALARERDLWTQLAAELECYLGADERPALF